MSSGFAGGVATLVLSRYAQLGPEQARQILRNTARGTSWDPFLGHGILDAEAAVTLSADQLAMVLSVDPVARISGRESGTCIQLVLRNRGVFDVSRALIIVYNGDPMQPADPSASREKPNILLVRQLGHTR